MCYLYTISLIIQLENLVHVHITELQSQVIVTN